MKFTNKLLFALCTFVVLLFIYYSCWKLHVQFWGYQSHVESSVTMRVTKAKPIAKVTARGNTSGTKGHHQYGTTNAFIRASLPVIDTEKVDVVSNTDSELDSQGFLLTLDGKLSPELVQQYENLSDGACKPGYATAMMAAVCPKFDKVKPAPMFLDLNFKELNLNNYLPPFGFKLQENTINEILSVTKSFGLNPELEKLTCKRCIIVGNGGILTNKSLGSRIDEYDIVVRLNQAPVSKYTRDVGTKTTMRITYPEAAFQNENDYEKDSLFVFSAFKPIDLKWLKHMVLYGQWQGTGGFWRRVGKKLPKKPSEMRILNPYFIQEAAFKFIGLPLNNGMMGKGNTPTIGTVAITMALHNCDEVAVAGFGYDMSKPNSPLHYFENVKMAAIKESWTHDISKEKQFLKKLVKAKVITDLTNGI